MFKQIDEYRFKKNTYGFDVQYRVLEGETEEGDYDSPTFHEPDQLMDVYISNVEVYDPENDTWHPVTDQETVLEIENSITLDKI